MLKYKLTDAGEEDVIPAPEVGALSEQSAPACPVGRSGILPERFRTSRNDKNLNLWRRSQGNYKTTGGAGNGSSKKR